MYQIHQQSRIPNVRVQRKQYILQKAECQDLEVSSFSPSCLAWYSCFPWKYTLVDDGEMSAVFSLNAMVNFQNFLFKVHYHWRRMNNKHLNNCLPLQFSGNVDGVHCVRIKSIKPKKFYFHQHLRTNQVIEPGAVFARCCNARQPGWDIADEGFCWEKCIKMGLLAKGKRFAWIFITLELSACGPTPEMGGSQDLRSTGMIWSEPGKENHLVLEVPDLTHLSLRLYLQGVFQDP